MPRMFEKTRSTHPRQTKAATANAKRGQRYLEKIEAPPTGNLKTGETSQIEIVVHKRSPSLNQWNNKHWKVYRKVKTAWRDRVQIAIIEFWRLFKDEPIQQCSLFIERYGVYDLDHDNFVGGCKPIVDSLVQDKSKNPWGILQDDTSKVIMHSEYTQISVKHYAEEKTRIVIQWQNPTT